MSSALDLDIRLPAAECEDQDKEWCEVLLEDGPRRIRFHDYDEIYRIEGLYERIFYEVLRCQSPTVVGSLLEEEVQKRNGSRPSLRILDLGAGNGMVGAELSGLDPELMVGVDIIPEAAEAAERDRPGLYDRYEVVDMTDLPVDANERLEGDRFNCLITVAALGFGDIPPRAFARALDLVEEGGLVAFTIKDSFLAKSDRSGFSDLIDRLVDEDALELRARKRYRHRDSVAGDPLHYVAFVAVKRGPVKDEWLEAVEALG